MITLMQRRTNARGEPSSVSYKSFDSSTPRSPDTAARYLVASLPTIPVPVPVPAQEQTFVPSIGRNFRPVLATSSLNVRKERVRGLEKRSQFSPSVLPSKLGTAQGSRLVPRSARRPLMRARAGARRVRAGGGARRGLADWVRHPLRLWAQISSLGNATGPMFSFFRTNKLVAVRNDTKEVHEFIQEIRPNGFEFSTKELHNDACDLQHCMSSCLMLTASNQIFHAMHEILGPVN
jgi:hypothetical protein